ncbi:uncharacterized protein [Rhodnius prolixus]|uniref:Uncharacterized protein n=1 Tax=Rhodnius prolixus TaxID=13249 RepID=T1IA65_RHOPR
MYSLVFLALIGLAAAAPQAIMPYSYGIMPYTSHITPYMHPGMMPVNSGIMGIMPKMIIPGIMTPDILKPVDDTPEVKQAKAAFAIEYQKALMGTRQKRDIATPFHTIPITSNINMMPYMNMMPNIGRSMYDIYSTPIVAHF